MINGFFTDGRPFVSAQVVIPYINDSGRLTAVRAVIWFLVDTGAEQTFLSPFAAWGHLRLPPSAAPAPPGRMMGLGGPVAIRSIAGTLQLVDESGAPCSFELTFPIPQTAPGQPSLPYSLLGSDVWGTGVLTIDRPDGRVLLDLPSAPGPG